MATLKVMPGKGLIMWIPGVTRVVDTGKTVKRDTDYFTDEKFDREYNFKVITVYLENNETEELQLLPGTGFLMEDGKTVDRI